MFVKPLIWVQLRTILSFVEAIGLCLSKTNIEDHGICLMSSIPTFRPMSTSERVLECLLSCCIIANHRTIHAHCNIAGHVSTTILNLRLMITELKHALAMFANKIALERSIEIPGFLEGGYCNRLLSSSMVLTQIITSRRCWKLSSRKPIAFCKN